MLEGPGEEKHCAYRLPSLNKEFTYLLTYFSQVWEFKVLFRTNFEKLIQIPGNWLF